MTSVKVSAEEIKINVSEVKAATEPVILHLYAAQAVGYSLGGEAVFVARDEGSALRVIQARGLELIATLG